MKIDVLIPSRYRSQSMQAVIVGLHALESGVNDVRYNVVCDNDDSETSHDAARLKGMHLQVRLGPRDLINARENALIARSDADVFMPWADDLFALTPAWDEIIRQIVEKSKVPAFSWQEVQDPRNHTAIVLEAKWVRAAGRFFPEHFPFWFADTWLKEVFGFVYGQDMPIVEHLRFSHKRTDTLNMHDLAFWFKVFAQTRHERIDEAKRICTAYGIPWIAKPQLVELFERGDALQLERVPQYEEAFGSEKNPPSEMYLRAKAEAEKLFNVKNVFEEAA